MARTDNDDGIERTRRNRRTALWLALLALAFYLGFIALGVLNS
jgi:hypothetical protein